MPDVEITYNNSTITSLSDSGTEVLETSGTYLTDDITVAYTKSGGGGGSTTVSFDYTIPSIQKVYYVDATGIVHDLTLEPEYPTVTFTSLSGSLIAALGAIEMIQSKITGGTLIDSLSLGSRATYKYLTIVQAD